MRLSRTQLRRLIMEQVSTFKIVGFKVTDMTSKFSIDDLELENFVIGKDITRAELAGILKKEMLKYCDVNTADVAIFFASEKIYAYFRKDDLLLKSTGDSAQEAFNNVMKRYES